MQPVLVGEKGMAWITCEKCNHASAVDLSKRPDSQANSIDYKCANCAAVFKIYCEFRKSQRKEVHLNGTFIQLPKEDMGGRIEVEDISTIGIRFRTRVKYDFKLGDILKLTFTLDDINNTVINQVVEVRWISGLILGGEFKNQDQWNQEQLNSYCLPEIKDEKALREEDAPKHSDLEKYSKSSYSVYNLKFHIVWTTKYRKPVLQTDIAQKLRDLIRGICKSIEVKIIKGRISRDHVHISVSLPPHVPVSQVVKSIKNKTSRELITEFKALERIFWGHSIWSEGYFAASFGEVASEEIAGWVDEQIVEPPDGDFKIDDDL